MRSGDFRDIAEDLRSTAQRRWPNPAGLFALSAAARGGWRNMDMILSVLCWPWQRQDGRFWVRRPSSQSVPILTFLLHGTN